MLSDCFCSLSHSPTLCPSVYLWFCSVFLFCCCCQKSIGPPAGRLGVRAHITHTHGREEFVEEGNKQHKLDGCPEQPVDGREGKQRVYTG